MQLRQARGSGEIRREGKRARTKPGTKFAPAASAPATGSTEKGSEAMEIAEEPAPREQRVKRVTREGVKKAEGLERAVTGPTNG